MRLKTVRQVKHQQQQQQKRRNNRKMEILTCKWWFFFMFKNTICSFLFLFGCGFFFTVDVHH